MELEFSSGRNGRGAVFVMFRPGDVLRLVEARIGSVHNPPDSARGSPVNEVVSLKVRRL